MFVMYASLPHQTLIETYHGVYINVVYEVVCTMTRGGFKKDLVADIEYIVEVPVREYHPSFLGIPRGHTVPCSLYRANYLWSLSLWRLKSSQNHWKM